MFLSCCELRVILGLGLARVMVGVGVRVRVRVRAWIRVRVRVGGSRPIPQDRAELRCRLGRLREVPLRLQVPPSAPPGTADSVGKS